MGSTRPGPVDPPPFIGPLAPRSYPWGGERVPEGGLHHQHRGGRHDRRWHQRRRAPRRRALRPRTASGRLHAVSATCTHQGCLVRFNSPRCPGMPLPRLTLRPRRHPSSPAQHETHSPRYRPPRPAQTTRGRRRRRQRPSTLGNAERATSMRVPRRRRRQGRDESGAACWACCHRRVANHASRVVVVIRGGGGAEHVGSGSAKGVAGSAARPYRHPGKRHIS